ncbi:MAG: hypothetical protein LJE64_12935 [Desulfofustis sp.]|jgi:purine-nucleoside phosphorylase|nr:hypothetical protein [Desulfofustis sp.]
MTEKDLIIEPRRGRKEQLLPGRALMVVNPVDADLAAEVFLRSTGKTWEVARPRIVVDGARRLCVAGPALGAPAAALLLEKLVVLGVTEIWLVSCCGSLDPSHAIGDLLIGTRAVSGEGVSRYYSEAEVVEPGSAATEELREFAETRSMTARSGTIWSTDAPYRERRSELLRLQERDGIVGVDMEFSALCTVASFRSVGLGALFVVSDMLWTGSWKPGFGKAALKEANRNLIEKIIQYGLSKGA